MSNRQARREQSRARRAQRAAARSRASRRSPGGGGRRGGGSWLAQPFTLLAIGLAVILAVVLGVILVVSGSGESSDAAQALEQAAADLPADLASGLKLGSDDAPLKLTEYEDFQCPFCLRYTALQEPTIVREYVTTGKLQLIYQHFPGLGRESVWAANAASCAADQNMFWQYANYLFLLEARAGQLDDERVNVGRFDLDKLKSYGREVGIPDLETFDACVDDLDHEQEIVDQEARARSLGITGTPGFLLNGQPLATAGALSTLDQWRSLFDQALAAVDSGELTPVVVTATPEATSPEPAATETPAGQ